MTNHEPEWPDFQLSKWYKVPERATIPKGMKYAWRRPHDRGCIISVAEVDFIPTYPDMYRTEDLISTQVPHKLGSVIRSVDCMLYTLVNTSYRGLIWRPVDFTSEHYGWIYPNDLQSVLGSWEVLYEGVEDSE